MPTLLFLCHANIARSPAADLLARAHLGTDSGWSVRSAGTNARSGYRIDTHIGQALHRRGIETSGHRSAQADAAMLAEAQLILTFETVQRSWVLRELPGAVRRVFTIRRAAAVIADGGVDALADDAGVYTPDDDFADPHGLGAAVAETAVAEIDRLLHVILPALESSDLSSEASPAPTPRSSVFDLFGDRST